MFLISYILIGAGLVFAITVAIGFYKFNDPYVTIHLACINDMLAVPLILLGCILIAITRSNYVAVTKLSIMIIAIYIAAPIAGYIMVRVCYFIKSFAIDSADKQIESK